MIGEAQQELGSGQGYGLCTRGRPKNVIENLKRQALGLEHYTLAQGEDSVDITMGLGLRRLIGIESSLSEGLWGKNQDGQWPHKQRIWLWERF